MEHRGYDTGLHLIVAGVLDGASAPRLRRYCERTPDHDAETVLLDLSDLTSMDSSGLDVLFDVYARFGERLVIIVGPPGAHAIDLENVRDVLPIIEG